MSTKERIPWPPKHAAGIIFDRVTGVILSDGPLYPPPFLPDLLQLLTDCEFGDGAGAAVGATYKQLAMIGHMVGMDAAERNEWYGVATYLGLTQRHAGHIIARVQDGALDRRREESRLGEMVDQVFKGDGIM